MIFGLSPSDIGVERGTRRISAAAPKDVLGEGRHPLAGPFFAGHDVISQVRLVDENARRG